VTLVVSDNSPLNLLIRLGQSDILPKLFQQIFSPPEVAHEMMHAKAPQAVRTFMASPPAWLRIVAPRNQSQIPNLDPGESAAINLAIELKAILMIDERDARAVASAKGIQIVGAIGVLERAANEELIPDLGLVYGQIKSLRFHVSDEILKVSLARHEALRQSKRNP
jgi:predicted nucleic acid-binding protein